VVYKVVDGLIYKVVHEVVHEVVHKVVDEVVDEVVDGVVHEVLIGGLVIVPVNTLLQRGFLAPGRPTPHIKN